jgi:hypothetical protein
MPHVRGKYRAYADLPTERMSFLLIDDHGQPVLITPFARRRTGPKLSSREDTSRPI